MCERHGPYYHGNEAAALDPAEIRIVVQLRAVSRPNASPEPRGTGARFSSDQPRRLQAELDGIPRNFISRQRM